MAGIRHSAGLLPVLLLGEGETESRGWPAFAGHDGRVAMTAGGHDGRVAMTAGGYDGRVAMTAGGYDGRVVMTGGWQ